MRRLAGTRINVVGLVLAAGGIVLQIGAGSDLYPTIPPGPVILGAGAAVVAAGPRSLAPYVATIVPAFVIVGGLIASVVNGAFVDQLSGVGQPGVLMGSWVQVVGLITAFAAGVRMWTLVRSQGNVTT